MVTFGHYEILSRLEIEGGGFDALVQDPDRVLGSIARLAEVRTLLD